MKAIKVDECKFINQIMEVLDDHIAWGFQPVGKRAEIRRVLMRRLQNGRRKG